jgi:quercetin dioxygenase-like cupin family protein
MRRAGPGFVLGVLCLLAGPAGAETDAAHRIVTPAELAWKPAGAAFPPGSEVAALYGDPSKPGPFALRVRAPKGYRLAPHTHPGPELVTVLSGALRIGVGGRVDPAAEQVVRTGGFSAMPPGLAHWVAVEEDVVLQIGGDGPWGIDYLDPEDDPRRARK